LQNTRPRQGGTQHHNKEEEQKTTTIRKTIKLQDWKENKTTTTRMARVYEYVGGVAIGMFQA